MVLIAVMTFIIIHDYYVLMVLLFNLFLIHF